MASGKSPKSAKKKAPGKPAGKSRTVPGKKTAGRAAARSVRKKAAKTVAKPARGRKKRGAGKKTVWILVLVFVILAAAGIAILLTNLNFLVKSAIEKFGSRATQTAVRVEGVRISLREGSGRIKGLTVANPEGFETAHAFSLGEIGVDIDVKSLAGEIPCIEDIVIGQPEVFIEVNDNRENNLEKLKGNLTTSQGRAASSGPAKKRTGEKIIEIRQIRFTGGRIHVLLIPMEKREYDLNLSPFTIRNLRGTPQEIAAEVVRQLSGRALSEMKKKGVSQARKKAGEEADRRLKEEAKQRAGRLLPF